MRVTSHNGRWGSAKHNGRDFDAQRADHIDPDRVALNQYWFWDMTDGDSGGAAFEGSELRYYEQQFGAALELQNERHRKHGDHKRVRSMADTMKAVQRRPEESIWQIGNMNDQTDPEVFMECVNEYLAWQMDWAEDNGQPFQVLNAAVHLDEASPHAHVRRVWQYQDDAGVWQIGQNKALAAAGVPLPDPAKPEGAKNNRKMVFDAMCREKWLDICEAHGFEVEREADKGRSQHMEKADFIAQQERMRDLQAKEAAVEAVEAAAATKLTEAGETLTEAREALTEAQRAVKRLQGTRNDMFVFLGREYGDEALVAFFDEFGNGTEADEEIYRAAKQRVAAAAKIAPTKEADSEPVRRGPAKPVRTGSYEERFAAIMAEKQQQGPEY